MMRKNCFPIGSQDPSLLAEMEDEYKSLLRQYENFQEKERQEMCCFCQDKFPLNRQEQERHRIYHLKYQEYLGQKENMEQNIIKEAFYQAQKWNYTEASYFAINKVKKDLKKQLLQLTRSFDQIKDVPLPVTNGKEKRLKEDVVPFKLPLIWEREDNKSCPTCGEMFQLRIDRHQDDEFVYMTDAVRCQDIVYCNFSCAGPEAMLTLQVPNKVILILTTSHYEFRHVCILSDSYLESLMNGPFLLLPNKEEECDFLAYSTSRMTTSTEPRPSLLMAFLPFLKCFGFDLSDQCLGNIVIVTDKEGHGLSNQQVEVLTKAMHSFGIL